MADAAADVAPDDRISEREWETLLERLSQGLVTAVIGAGTSRPYLGAGADIASGWAEEVGFPGEHADHLASVAQYVATTYDPARSNEYLADRIGERLKSFSVADIVDRNDPYRMLTQQPLPVWVTTNYDDLIVRGLRAANKQPVESVCRWRPPERFWDPIDPETPPTPTAQAPLVFHMHGRYGDPPSMVISESDYLDFLQQMAIEDLLPSVVRTSLAKNSLIFLGYSFRDTNLQLMLRGWMPQRRSVAVMPAPPSLGGHDLAKFKDYFPQYVQALTGHRVDMFWGTASEFCAALAMRLGDAG